MPKKLKPKPKTKPLRQILNPHRDEQYESDLHTGKMFMARIDSAKKTKGEWERKFKCDKLEEYYEGKQWKDDENYVPYVLNLFYSTIEIKNPALLFRNPTFYCTPLPGGYNFDPETAFAKASLCTDTINTLFLTSGEQFGIEIQNALLQSMFRFGLIEVGYGANWITNPNANKPIHEDQYEPDLKGKEDTTTEPEMIPEEEFIYLKSIPAHRVLIGGWAAKTLEKTNWVAYDEYIPSKDLQDPSLGLRNLDKINLNVIKSQDYTLDEDEDMSASPLTNESNRKGDLVRIWHLYDNRVKKHFLIENSSRCVIKEISFKRLPLKDLRFSLRTRGWLPIPYTYNWKSPQDEQNEALEQLRAARRRTKRVFTKVANSVEEEEEAKLLSGPDGTVITTSKDNALMPLEFGRLDPVVGQSLQLSKENFLIVSGTTTEAQGQSDRVTATQANITNTRSGIRENKDREIVAQWLCSIAHEALLLAIEKFTLPIWVKLNADSKATWGGEVEEISARYQEIKADDLAGIKLKMSIEVDTMSPVANEIEKNKFLNFMAVMNQYPQIALHPDLIREAAFRLDYRNEKVIKAFQQAALLQMMGQVAGAAGPGVPPNMAPNTPMAQRTAEQLQPPDQAAIENQTAAQGVPQ